MKTASRPRAARVREDRARYRADVPGPLYCDASALMKLYMSEPGSDDFNRIVAGRTDLLVSDLAVTEVVSALCRRARRNEVTLEDVRRVRHAILTGLDGGVYERVELTRDVHRRAEQALVTAPGTPLRAGDGLHLALALSARASSMASFDVRLATAARAAGLAVYPA